MQANVDATHHQAMMATRPFRATNRRTNATNTSEVMIDSRAELAMVRSTDPNAQSVDEGTQWNGSSLASHHLCQIFHSFSRLCAENSKAVPVTLAWMTRYFIS